MAKTKSSKTKTVKKTTNVKRIPKNQLKALKRNKKAILQKEGLPIPEDREWYLEKGIQKEL
ncbi:hypothetical protein FDN13_01645 [Caloramator sp. E03]|uniref:hypothetical protein n=1 Tax=Caloramator sp. E03 TaxID=2576307 RepID=UPI0011102AA1|nr:hypothetical protein [Caloramator sp. E03]QCX32504.1 hypothetical protein FDN13_01645 [Caloramator sp. E03]